MQAKPKYSKNVPKKNGLRQEITKCTKKNIAVSRCCCRFLYGLFCFCSEKKTTNFEYIFHGRFMQTAIFFSLFLSLFSVVAVLFPSSLHVSIRFALKTYYTLHFSVLLDAYYTYRGAVSTKWEIFFSVVTAKPPANHFFLWIFRFTSLHTTGILLGLAFLCTFCHNPLRFFCFHCKTREKLKGCPIFSLLHWIQKKKTESDERTGPYWNKRPNLNSVWSMLECRQCECITFYAHHFEPIIL